MTRRPTSHVMLFVHAHPDDESSKFAATAARYVDEGARVVLVTCTDGAAGEVLNPKAPPVEAHEMAVVRSRELAHAAAIIGFSHVVELGFPDSGMPEPPETVAATSFAGLPVDVPAAALAAVVREERPHVVVTYPSDGGYAHPDHVRTHAVTLRACELAAAPGADLPGEPWEVAKLYVSGGFPMERLIAIDDALTARGMPSPYTAWIEARRRRGVDEPAPTTRVEVGAWFERRDDALRAHRTQIDPDGFWFAVPRDVEVEAYPYESYTLLRSSVPVPPAEHDLFAGLP